MSDLRSRLIRLAAANPELRADLLPLLQEQSDPASVDQNKPESYYGLAPRGVQASYRKEAMSLIGLTEEDRDAVLRMYMQREKHGHGTGYAYSGEPAFSVRSFKFTKGTVSRLMKYDYAKDGSDFYSSGGTSSLRLTQQGILAGKFIRDNPDEKFEKVLGYPVSFTRRVYGQFQVYTWASIRINNEWVSLGDPYPAPRWPRAALEKSVALAAESQAEAPRGVQAAATRTAGIVSVRVEHGFVTVEGTSVLGRDIQVATLDARESGTAATRAAISVASEFGAAMEQMSSPDEAIGFLERKVFEITSRRLRWKYSRK